jgi:hypothetical protein
MTTMSKVITETHQGKHYILMYYVWQMDHIAVKYDLSIA